MYVDIIYICMYVYMYMMQSQVYVHNIMYKCFHVHDNMYISMDPKFLYYEIVTSRLPYTSATINCNDNIQHTTMFCVEFHWHY